MLQVLLIALLGVLGADANDYTQKGPYGTLVFTDGFKMPSTTGCGRWTCNLKLTVTKPVQESTGYTNGPEPPFPLVFMFSGFKMYSSYYEDYVKHLASYGYVVIQYDTKFFHLYSDLVETSFVSHLLDWVEDMNSEPGSFLYNIVDVENIGMAGHSRGGKLSALGIASLPNVRAAYLIDPVDGDNLFTKGSKDYPSGLKALDGLDKKIGIVGSGIQGHCIPEGLNYEEYYKVAGPGSWLTVLEGAGHCQFISAPPLFEWAMGLLCGHSHDSCVDIIFETVPGLVAWFEEEFRGAASGEGLLDDYFTWTEKMVEEKVFAFTVKEDPALSTARNKRIVVIEKDPFQDMQKLATHEAIV